MPFLLLLFTVSCSQPEVLFIGDPYWESTIGAAAGVDRFFDTFPARREPEVLRFASALSLQEAASVVQDTGASQILLSPLHAGLSRELAEAYPARHIVGIAAEAAPELHNLSTVKTDRRAAFVQTAKLVAGFGAVVSAETREGVVRSGRPVVALFYTGNQARREERAAFLEELETLGVRSMVEVRDFDRLGAVRDVTTYLREGRDTPVDLFLVLLSGLSDPATAIISSIYTSYVVLENSLALPVFGDRLLASVEVDWTSALTRALDVHGTVPAVGRLIPGPAAGEDRFGTLASVFR